VPVAPTPPTPTPVAPTPGCIPLTATRSSISAADACVSTKTGTHYFDNGNFCAATAYYGTTAGCSSLYASAVYIAVSGNYRFWNGSAFTTSCQGCP
jgi:hypothetical protein